MQYDMDACMCIIFSGININFHLIVSYSYLHSHDMQLPRTACLENTVAWEPTTAWYQEALNCKTMSIYIQQSLYSVIRIILEG